MPERLVAPENDYTSIIDKGPIDPQLEVAVVIPVYNRVDLLRMTLAGLCAQDYPRDLMRIIIGDDGSDEDVEEVAAVFAGQLDIDVVRRDHDGYGAGQARNLAAALVTDGVLVFFDGDCIPDAQAVSRHAHWHHVANNLVVIGSRHQIDSTDLDPDSLVEKNNGLRILAFGVPDPEPDRWESDDFRKVLHRRSAFLRYGDEAYRSLVSSNFSTLANVFHDVGGFSDDFTRWGGEDTELGWRLWNEANFFIDEPTAAIYHQTQVDAGPEGWRQSQRHSNDGLIQAKVPHRFYRKPLEVINETPKVSVVVHSSDLRLDEVSGQLLDQRLSDLELLVVGSSDRVLRFVERRHGDRRFAMAGTVDHAIIDASGEFIAFLHGSSAPDHRLLSRSVAAIERRPRAGLVRSAFGVRHSEGQDTYRTHDDIDMVESDWHTELPVFGMTRRRDLLKTLKTGGGAAEAWQWVEANLDRIDHNAPLVWLPSPSEVPDFDGRLAPPTSLRSELLSDLKSGGRTALTAPVRAMRTAVGRSSFREHHASPVRPKPTRDNPRIRYVGWTGRGNMGDEAMLVAVRDLMPWAEIGAEGNAGNLLMLGGGTLINRGYLRQLRALDSPRVERVIFGTGVANPDYWGEPKENIKEWTAFLDSCGYVGVRGPLSAELLSDWGVRRPIEIVGDPALSLVPSADTERTAGRIVLCPAWSRGLLWGGSDDKVIDAFSQLTKRLLADGHEVWALSAFPADDRHIIDMMRRAEAPDLPYLAAHDNPRAAVDLLASADLVVAERLHGAVLAAAAGSVPVMVEYRPKLRDFAASVDLEELVIRTDELDGNKLIDLTKSAMDDLDNLQSAMGLRVNYFRSKQGSAADLIRSLIVDSS